MSEREEREAELARLRGKKRRSSVVQSLKAGGVDDQEDDVDREGRMNEVRKMAGRRGSVSLVAQQFEVSADDCQDNTTNASKSAQISSNEDGSEMQVQHENASKESQNDGTGSSDAESAVADDTDAAGLSLHAEEEVDGSQTVKREALQAEDTESDFVANGRPAQNALEDNENGRGAVEAESSQAQEEAQEDNATDDEPVKEESSQVDMDLNDRNHVRPSLDAEKEDQGGNGAVGAESSQSQEDMLDESAVGPESVEAESLQAGKDAMEVGATGDKSVEAEPSLAHEDVLQEDVAGHEAESSRAQDDVAVDANGIDEVPIGTSEGSNAVVESLKQTPDEVRNDAGLEDADNRLSVNGEDSAGGENEDRSVGVDADWEMIQPSPIPVQAFESKVAQLALEHDDMQEDDSRSNCFSAITTPFATAGKRVSGFLLVECVRTVQVSRVHVNLTGTETAAWLDGLTSKQVCESRKVVDKNVAVVQEGRTFEAGQNYTLPFEFIVPDSLSASFLDTPRANGLQQAASALSKKHGQPSSVSYSIRAIMQYVNVDGADEKGASGNSAAINCPPCSILVFEAARPENLQAVQSCASKSVLLGGNSKLKISLLLPQSAVRSGECLVGSVEIDNGTRRKVESVTAIIWQTVELRAQGKTLKRESAVQRVALSDGSVSGKSKISLPLKLEVPQNAFCVSHGALVKVQHVCEIRAELNTPGGLVVRVPLQLTHSQGEPVRAPADS